MRNGVIDRRAVAGKDVLIGATAIEMGDRYAVPRWGVIPGVVVQALAAETLLEGVPTRGSAILSLLLGLAGAMLFLRQKSVVKIALAIVGSFGLAGLCVLTAQTRLLRFYPIAPVLVMMIW